MIQFNFFMNNIKKKEKNLDDLLNKIKGLRDLNHNSELDYDKINKQKNQLALEKKMLEEKNLQLIREHDFLKKKLIELKAEIKNKNQFQHQLDQEINDLNQDAETLFEEVKKWQT